MIGPHVIRPTPAALRWASRARIVKQIDGTEALRAAPDCAIRVFRAFLSQADPADGAETARAVLERLGSYRHPNLYIELWNEAHPTADALKEAVAVGHAAGVKVAVGSWGTGDYTDSDWQAARASGADAVAVHCYWADRGFTIWNALRYRQFWRSGDPPVLITECGRDRVRDGDGGTWVGKGGWHADGISAEQYIAELAAYDRLITADPFVLGACVFTAGATPDWANYDTDAISDSIRTEDVMALADQFPSVYKEWVAAGGIENNFRKHLLGIGAIQPTKDDLAFLLDQLQADLNQAKGVLAKLSLA